MATFSALKNRVNFFVDDDSLETLIAEFINQGVSEIAGGWPSLLDGVNNPIPNILTPPLPGLFTINTVNTSLTDAFVDMPSNFNRDMQFVASSSGSEIDIANSFIEFTSTYPLLDKVGRISEVIEHGNKLYYQGIPANSESITVHYYREPIEMVNDNDVPDGIPEHLQISLLVNFASWKVFEYLEDGLEGETPNTIKFKNLFLESVRTLELFLPSYTRGLMLR